MLLSILENLTEGKQLEGRCTGKLNLIPGFDCNTGNYREYKKILEAFGIPYTMLADISDVFDSPLDGTYRIYPGGTGWDDAADSINGKATITLGPYATPKSFGWIKDNYSGKHVSMPTPFGIEKTDAFIMKLAELFGKEVPESIKAERGRAVDAMTDSHQYIHNKKFAVYGDPDYLLGYVPSCWKWVPVPYHILCSRGRLWKLAKEIQELLDSSPYGKDGKIYINKDLWHLRSLVMTDPVDAIIGDTHAKFVAR